MYRVSGGIAEAMVDDVHVRSAVARNKDFIS